MRIKTNWLQIHGQKIYQCTWTNVQNVIRRLMLAWHQNLWESIIRNWMQGLRPSIQGKEMEHQRLLEHRLYPVAGGGIAGANFLFSVCSPIFHMTWLWRAVHICYYWLCCGGFYLKIISRIKYTNIKIMSRIKYRNIIQRQSKYTQITLAMQTWERRTPFGTRHA